MFKVKIIGGGILYTVYAVRDYGGIEFLLYHHRHKWYWQEASKFEPI